MHDIRRMVKDAAGAVVFDAMIPICMVGRMPGQVLENESIMAQLTADQQKAAQAYADWHTQRKSAQAAAREAGAA